MMHRRKFAALLAVGLMAAACGSDDDPTTDEAPATEAATDATDDATDGDAMADWPDKLVFGFVPSREADQLVDSADALAAVLAEATGLEVESFVSQDYTALTEAMASGQTQIGAFGPLGVVRAIDNAGVEFVLQSSRFGSFTYHTQYMTNDPDTFCEDEPVANEDGWLFCNGTLDAAEGPAGESAIAKITADTELAYVDPTSASGYLIPALQMQNAGIDISGFETFAGGHDASVQAVYDGDATVGLSFNDARGTIEEQFPDVGEKVVVFAYSPEIPNDGFVVSGDLPQDLVDIIVEALLAYAETEEGATTLDELYEIGGLREANAADLDVIREALDKLGDSFEG